MTWLLKAWAFFKKIPWWGYVVLVTLASLGGWALERRSHNRTKHELNSERQATEDQKTRADAAEKRAATDSKTETEYKRKYGELHEKLHQELSELSARKKRIDLQRGKVRDAAGNTDETLAVLRNVLSDDSESE